MEDVDVDFNDHQFSIMIDLRISLAFAARCGDMGYCAWILEIAQEQRITSRDLDVIRAIREAHRNGHFAMESYLTSKLGQ